MADASVASITFAASSDVTNAGRYTVAISTGFGPSFSSSATKILASASLTYTYVDPCKAAVFTHNWGDHFAGKSYSANVLGTPYTDAGSIGIDSVSLQV
jgi:hypothetical protein